MTFESDGARIEPWLPQTDGHLILVENEANDSGSHSNLAAAALDAAGINYWVDISGEVTQVTYQRYSGMVYLGLQGIQLFLRYKAEGLVV